jgi:hypothetical protein
MANTVSVVTSSFYGELERGVGVKFMDVIDQGAQSYTRAVDSFLGKKEGNKLPTGIVERVNTQNQIDHFLSKASLGYPQIFSEGAAIPQDSDLIGYKTSVATQYHGSSVTITKRAIMDRDYNDKLDHAKQLARRSSELMDFRFFDLFNYAFTAQTSLPIDLVGYGDGKPMCSTLHPRLDGGSNQSNASSTGLILSDDNLETARNALQRQLDDRGKETMSGSGKLILLVSPENEKLALQLAKSEKKINTANNNINIYDGLITVISSKWLGSASSASSAPTTQWFLIDPEMAQLKFLMRQDIAPHMAEDANTMNKTFYITSRWAYSWADWRGIWGSKGDGAAYSS